MKWVHPFAEMVSIYASMPDEPTTDSTGRRTGCYLVSTLDEVLRNPKWRLETLEAICLRMRRGIGNKTCAKEWVDVEHTHSKPILLRRKEDPPNLLTLHQSRGVEFFCVLSLSLSFVCVCGPYVPSPRPLSRESRARSSVPYIPTQSTADMDTKQNEKSQTETPVDTKISEVFLCILLLLLFLRKLVCLTPPTRFLFFPRRYIDREGKGFVSK